MVTNEEVKEEDSFIIEDDEEGFRDTCLSSTVTTLLQYRQKIDETQGIPEKPRKVARSPRRFEAEEHSALRNDFQASCARNKPKMERLDAVQVETFLDLKDYDMGYRENKGRQPGTLRMIYCFYSRLYDKLLAKQKGKDVAFFTPELPPESRKFGFREVIDFQRDFGLQSIITRRGMESCYLHVLKKRFAGQDDAFVGGMTFDEFVDFMGLVSLYDEHNSRPDDTLCQQSAKFARKMALNKPKELKGQLWNAWRDTHFWRLSEDEPFDRQARFAARRAIPDHKVKPVPQKLRNKRGWKSLRRYLQQFEWADTGPLWEKFEGPYVDMGVSLIGQTKKFKITLRNLRHHLMRFQFEVDNLGPLTMPIPEVAIEGLCPGQSCTIPLEPYLRDEGEFTSSIRLVGTTSAGEVYPFEIPVYVRACFPHEGERCGRELPPMAPHPFRKQVFIPPQTQPASVSTPIPVTYEPSRTFVIDACSNTNLTPRIPRLYGRPLSGLRRPTSATTDSMPTVRTLPKPIQRPTTAPNFRTKETPRAVSRPKSAHVCAPATRGSRPSSAETRWIPASLSSAAAYRKSMTPSTTARFSSRPVTADTRSSEAYTGRPDTRGLDKQE